KAFVSIIPSFRGGASAINRELSGVTGKAADTAGKKSGRRFGGMFIGGLKGLAGPLAAVMGAQAVTGFLKDAVTGAGDLNEETSKTGVVFGKAAKDVLRFAEDANTSMGQTKTQALQAAGTFGVFGKAAGLTGRDLSGFSTEMVTLASDLASFHNTSPEEAIEALGAALRGESEPIRRYGVLLDDASLREEALRQSLVKTTKEALTPQQKTLAAHALIMKQTADAQGDFQRTSGDLANQQRILSAQWSDLKTTLGAALLPIVNKVISVFNGWLPGIMDFVSGLTSGKGAASGFGTTLSTVFSTIGAVVGPILSTVVTLVKGLGQAFLAIWPSIQSLASQIVAVLVPGLRQIWNVIQTNVIPALLGFVK